MQRISPQNREPGARSGKALLPALSALLGLLALLFGLASGWRGCHGRDYMPLYVGGKALLLGRPLYAPGTTRDLMTRYCPPEQWAHFTQFDNTDCNPYPPSNAVLLAPLSLLPFSAARFLLYGLMSAALLFGLWQAMRAFAPAWTAGGRVWVLALAANSLTTRWGLEMLQLPPLLLGLFAGFLAALRWKRDFAAAALGALALCLKATLGIPFVLLALLLGRWRAAGGSAAFFAIFNLLLFALLGGGAALRDYGRQVAKMQAFEFNAPTPYLPLANARLDWEYLLNGLRLPPALSHSLALALTAAALLWLLWEAKRAAGIASDAARIALLTGPAACLTLLASYHHEYDACILLAPALLYGAIPFPEAARTAGRWFLAIIFFYACLHPAFREISQALGRVLHADAVIIERLSGSALVSLAFGFSLLALRRALISPDVLEVA